MSDVAMTHDDIFIENIVNTPKKGPPEKHRLLLRRAGDQTTRDILMISEKLKSSRDEIRSDAERQWKSDSSLRAEFSSNFESYLCWRAAEATDSAQILGGKVHG